MSSTPSRAAHPRSFTLREFWRGVFAAWLAFLIVLVLFALLFAAEGALMFLPYILLMGGAVSAIASLLGSPLAFALGWALRDVRSPLIHLLLFGLLGATVGILVVLVMSRGTAGLGDPFNWIVAGITALCVDAGWYWAYRRSGRDKALRQTPVSVP